MGHHSLAPIICIGASAGGLESIERFFKNCPRDTGAAFVVIQHLSSNYKSMMDDLINRYTAMDVEMIKDATCPEPDKIYLIEAGTTVQLEDSKFKVLQRSDKELSLPIDLFLSSIGDDQTSKAISIILSGTGSDGSRGAVSVNAHGGFVLAQTPTQAKFDGMPRSAINTGAVDHVLDVEAMPELVQQLLNNADQITLSESKVQTKPDLEVNSPNHLASIFSLLVNEYGLDFTEYKEGTVLRRIERRMQVKHISTYHDYADLLSHDPMEPKALRRELMIGVTEFFRDTQVFEKLAEVGIASLVRSAQERTEIRVWVAGCSSGEEAYSLAILLNEEIDRQQKRCSVKVFATDANPEAIELASKGLYPDTISGEVPAQLLQKYFDKTSEGYGVRPELRQQIVFAVHNLLTFAPFTKIDLVSCRNTLIYFKDEAQKEALYRLQYAVKQGGILLLGKSESLNINEEHFEALDRSLKIFKCVSKPSNRTLLSNISPQTPNIEQTSTQAVTKTPTLPKLEQLVESQLKKHFLPLSMLINHKHEVVHVYGENTDLLQIRPGEVTTDVSSFLPAPLSAIALTLLHRLSKEEKNLPIELSHNPNSLTNDTHSVKGWRVEMPDAPSHFVLCFLTEHEVASSSTISHQSIDSESAERIAQLEFELTATRESLQSTIEELETTNEELQATNEELVASNEELQSSNEELQSVNEELNTVNSEYHEKMSILNRINADLDAMSRSTGIATVFVDNRQNLTRFTPDATEIFRVRDQDIGRPLEEVVHYLNYDQLHDDINLTLVTGRSKESEVLAKNGLSYLVRIVNYKLPSSDVFGAAISLIESRSLGNYQKVMDALPEHIAVLDETGSIILVNQAWRRFAALNGGQLVAKVGVGANYLDACMDDQHSEEIAQGIQNVLQGDTDRFSTKYPCHSPTEKRWFIMEVRALKDDYFKAVVTHFNVTQWEA